MATYAGKHNSRITGNSSKKTPYSAEKGIEIQSPLIRKPLSPVSYTVLSKANIIQDPRNTQKVVKESITETPPPKPFIAGDEENRTPKNMGLPVPTTPLTGPMLTATTPDTFFVHSGSMATSKIAQPFEYSFEEVRAGFVLPKSYAQ